MGFEHVIDADLLELDFGAWDGLHWTAIAHAEVAAWEADFTHYRPGGGESLESLMARVRRFEARSLHGVVIGHAGWINAWRWLTQRPDETPSASAWPAPPAYGERVTAPPSSA